MPIRYAATVILLTAAIGCASVEPELPIVDFPADQPVSCAGDGALKFRQMQDARIEFARETYPQAKARWERGLGRGESFFITTIFLHPNGDEEQIFVLVEDIRGGVVSGKIANDPMGPGFQAWDSYSFPESNLRDWTIQHPDGREEGNYIGKFIDQFRGQCPN